MYEEIELKFALPESALARLRQNGYLKSLSFGPVKTRKLETRYFDTADGRLSRAGMALRMRRIGGENRMSLKWNADTAGLSRTELEVSVAGAEPDLGLIGDPAAGKKIGRLLKGRTLAPVFMTDVQRTTRRLMNEKGDIVELAIDTGAIHASGAQEPIAEAELELIAGDRGALIPIARHLVSECGARLNLESKAERGARIASGIGEEPQKAARFTLESGATAGEALRHIVGAALRHLTANEAALRKGRRSEAIHQLRVALRRLRASLQAFARELGSESLSGLALKARDFAGTLGAARDFDVFAETILAPVERAISSPAAFALLAGEVSGRREHAFEVATALLETAEFKSFVLDLAEIALIGADRRVCTAPEVLMAPARKVAKEILSTRLKKARKLGDRFDRLSTEERHEFRKELKKLRYPSEFFASLFSEKGAKRHFVCLSALQEDLGLMNDVATAQRLIADILQELRAEETHEKAIAIAFAGGEIIGWHSHRAAEAAERAAADWSAFTKGAPFWEEE